MEGIQTQWTYNYQGCHEIHERYVQQIKGDSPFTFKVRFLGSMDEPNRKYLHVVVIEVKLFGVSQHNWVHTYLNSEK